MRPDSYAAVELVVAFIMMGLGMFMLGLYLGERGRRRAAERLATWGTPEDGPAASTMRPAIEAEDRFAEAGKAFEKETIDRGTKALMEDAKRNGIKGYTEKDARADAQRMLSGEHVE